ncbi:MAG: dihydroorotate dehydrogenase-like protein [Bryobacteraceae bacterium]
MLGLRELAHDPQETGASMTQLAIDYLGLTLANPIVASAGPLQKDIGNIRRMEDAGMAAVVLHSLFEEEIAHPAAPLTRPPTAEPSSEYYAAGPDLYLEHLYRAKQAVNIPVMASLNGITPGGWVRYARQMQDAGADALELNIYDFPTDPEATAESVERRYEEMVREVRAAVTLPLAVKLSPYFTSPIQLAKRLSAAGADGLVLFNRYYQTDFDIDQLEASPNLHLSRPEELPLRLHWTGLIYGHVTASLAITGGVHSATDVVKAVMAGASAAMMTSCLLEQGIDHARTVLMEFIEWLDSHDYEAISQLRGNMSYRWVANKTAFERVNYLKVLSSYT